MLDGYLARKLHAESKTGAVLDSVADICFVVCCAIQLIPVCADSDVAVDLGRDDRRHQDSQSSFCANRLQAVLLSSHLGQQTDGISALSGRTDAVLVNYSDSNCGRDRFIRRNPGRPFHQDWTDFYFFELTSSLID